MKIIHGGGFTGLVLAHVFHQKKIPFLLFESSSKLGGLIQEKSTPYGLIQLGPQSILLKNNHFLTSFFKQDSLKKKTFFTPNGFKNKFSLLFPFLKNFFHPLKKRETLLESLQEVFSQETIDDYLDPILQGIFSTSSSLLTQDFIFPHKNFFQFLQQFSFLKSYSHAKSLHRFLLQLAEPFKDKIRLNESFSKLTQHEHYFCLPPSSLISYFPHLKELSSFPFIDLHQVHIFFKKEPSLLKNYDAYLFSNRLNLHVKGIIKKNNHFIFFYNENYKKEHLEKDLLFFTSSDNILYIHHTPYLKAFPLYNKKHYLLRESLLKKKEKNIHFLGSYLSFPGLRSLVHQIETTAL